MTLFPSASGTTNIPPFTNVPGGAVTIERERQAAQRAMLQRRREPLCVVCSDTGWAQVDGGGVRRCACADDRRREVLGQGNFLDVSPIDPAMQERGAAAMRALESQVSAVVAKKTMPTKTWDVKVARIQHALQRGDRSPEDEGI